MKKRPRGRPHGTPEKMCSFYPTVRQVKIGETKKWYIESITIQEVK